MFLAGDIGGTKTNLALFSTEDGKLIAHDKRSFASKNYSGLEPILGEFTSNKTGSILRACFAAACPVVKGKCETPNLPWILDARAIGKFLGLETVALINDLEATAYGIAILDAKEFAVLNDGSSEQEGNMALIAAGTGLGEATMSLEGDRYRPLASEGGHADFAPRTALEIELLRYLMARFDHVSYERVISGPGLLNIYNFLKDSGYFTEPAWLEEKFSRRDPSAVISEAAIAGSAEICVKALDLFVSVYGAEAGNLALRAKALRGVYLGGGIAPKIVTKLKDGIFMRSFTAKGRFTEFLSAIPVRVTLNDEAALLGAAYVAAFLVDRFKQ